MKKIVKLLLIAAMATIAVSASAQIGLGVKVGYANAKGKFRAGSDYFWSVPQHGVRLGVFYDLPLWKKDDMGLTFRPGINYTYLGSPSVIVSVRDRGFKDRNHLLGIPVDVKFYYAIGECKLYAFAGPKFSVGLSYLMKSGTAHAEAYTGKANRSDGSTIQAEPLFHRFNLLIGGGIGAEFKRAFIEIGYDWELLDEIRDKTLGYKMRRGMLGVDLGYTF